MSRTEFGSKEEDDQGYYAKKITVTISTYADILRNHIRPAMKSKWHGLLTKGVLLKQDNALPHVPHEMAVTIEDFNF